MIQNAPQHINKCKKTHKGNGKKNLGHKKVVFNKTKFQDVKELIRSYNFFSLHNTIISSTGSATL